MPSWKKLITSGSDASLTSLTVTNGVTGSLYGTASWAVSSSNAQNAQDILIYVKNVTGTQINKGSVVRISGATGDNALIATASYESDGLSANTLGLANQNIAHDSFGYVITEGTFIGLDTSTPGWTAGQLLYLGANGAITGSAPQAPLHAVRLGQVLRVQSVNGSMYVRIDNGYEIGELHDVRDTSTTSSFGDLLVKSGSVWTNSRQLTGSYGLTGSFDINGSVLITGSATIGSIAAGASENTLTLGPSPAGGAGEGGQLGLNAVGGTYTSASMIDTWQNYFRILKGSNAGSNALVAQWNLHTTQLNLPGYTAASSFPGTATANLAVNSSGDVITVSTSGGTVFPYTGNAVITGSLTTTGIIYAQPNGGMYFQGGDDAALYDINVANTMGIYGVQDSTIGSVKLGSGGGVISGKSGNIGINNTNPTQGTLDIVGNVYATSFTGSLFGTSSWATNVVGGIGVTSVSASGTVSGITLGGGPITGAGTLTLSGTISGLTNANLSGTAGITNANLANSTITIAGTSTSLGGSISQATILAGSGVFSGSAQISGLTNSNLSGTAGITNANLANSSVTIGSTAISLGSTATTIAGLTSVTSTTFVGALTGTSSWATSVVNTASNATAAATVNITLDNATNATYYPVFTSGISGNQVARVDNATLTYNPGTNTLTTSTFAGSLSGTATNATNINITDTPTTAATYYPVFVSATTGNVPARTDSSALTYNPNTNTLTTTTFAGSLSGTSTNATNIAITDDTTTNANMFPIFSSTSTGNNAARVDSSTLTYNPSTNTLTTTTFAGALTGNASTATSAATLTTARTLTIGSTGKSFNGSANVAWSLAEIGAQAALTNPVTGTGTTNYLSKFTGTSTLGNSQIFDNGTNVGINTATPGVKFVTVTGTPSGGPTLGSGTVGSQALLASNALYGMYSGVSNTGDVWHQVQRNDANSAVYGLLLQPNGGGVAINKGTTSPSYQLDITGVGFATTDFRAPIFYDSDNTGYSVNPAATSQLSTLNAAVSISAPIYYNVGSTSYYVNPGSTSRLLFIDNVNGITSQGAVTATSFVESANSAYYFDGGNTGDSIRTAGNIVAYYSDERLKDNKGNIENALEKLLTLNGFYYEPNERAQELGYKKKLEIGVSAQEVEAVLPEIVHDAPIGYGYKTLDYSKLVPLLIEAIKEQQKQIDELKSIK